MDLTEAVFKYDKKCYTFAKIHEDEDEGGEMVDNTRWGITKTSHLVHRKANYEKNRGIYSYVYAHVTPVDKANPLTFNEHPTNCQIYPKEFRGRGRITSNKVATDSKDYTATFDLTAVEVFPMALFVNKYLDSEDYAEDRFDGKIKNGKKYIGK